jgi:hypothetical protein
MAQSIEVHYGYLRLSWNQFLKIASYLVGTRRVFEQYLIDAAVGVKMIIMIKQIKENYVLGYSTPVDELLYFTRILDASAIPRIGFTPFWG